MTRRLIAADLQSAEGSAARFWAKVRRTETCWLWTAATNEDGYGLFLLGRRPVLAHRLAYIWHTGQLLAPDLELDHLCRHRGCVRPDHLDPVPHKVNVWRGDGLAAENRRKAECWRGHTFDLNNTRITRGKRYCRTCKRIRDAAGRAA